MTTICSGCGAIIPDISNLPHICQDRSGSTWNPLPSPLPINPTPTYFPPICPVKCDICGSTAIDHTEAMCQLNRQLTQARKPSKSTRPAVTGKGKSRKHQSNGKEKTL